MLKVLTSFLKQKITGETVPSIKMHLADEKLTQAPSLYF